MRINSGEIAKHQGAASLPGGSGAAQVMSRPATISAPAHAFRENAARQLASLTARQSAVLDHILTGSPSKNIATDLHISQRTVENHRAAIGKKLGTRSLSALLHAAICGRCYLESRCEPLGIGEIAPVCHTVRTHARLGHSSVAIPLVRPGEDPASLRIALAEVQHRLKNIVTIIQSISRQTLRQCETNEEFSARFTARLGAYCRSLDLLTATNWAEVEIGALVHAQLETFGMGDGNQIEAHGDKIQLMPSVANALALALHELATNALKHGALSVPSGKVKVTWKASGFDGFRLEWRETGGPEVTAPQRKGFGRHLLEGLMTRSVPGCSAYTFGPSGASWTVDYPSSLVLAA